MRWPLADTATVPPPVTPPGSWPWNQFAPLSLEMPIRFTFGFAVLSTLPTRTT